MPLLDLSRQIKNTDDIVFAGKDSAEMRWTKDASYSGSISGDFSDGSNDRIKVTMAGHGLTSLFNNDNEVIKINFPDNGNYSNFTPGEYVVYSIPHDDHLLLNNDTDGDGLDWAENLSGEGNGETWEYNRSASRLSITGDGTNDVFYVDSLQGRVFIGGSLDLAGQTAILDVAQVQLEDAILDLNFVDGAPNTLAYGGQGGFQIGDSLNTGVNAPQWLFNKGSDGSFEESFWHARYQNKDARLHTGHITSSGITAVGDVGITGSLTSSAHLLADSGTITTALDCATFTASTSIVLNSSTPITDVVVTSVGSTIGDVSHDTIPTSLAVKNHVNEVARKVMSYVDNMLHVPEFSISAIDTPGVGAQTVLWSGVLAADQFSTSANPTLISKGTMDKHDYNCTINGLNIEPSAITSLKDYVDFNNGYVELIFDTSALDFTVDAADEVVLAGPMRPAVDV